MRGGRRSSSDDGVERRDVISGMGGEDEELRARLRVSLRRVVTVDVVSFASTNMSPFLQRSSANAGYDSVSIRGAGPQGATGTYLSTDPSKYPSATPVESLPVSRI